MLGQIYKYTGQIWPSGCEFDRSVPVQASHFAETGVWSQEQGCSREGWPLLAGVGLHTGGRWSLGSAPKKGQIQGQKEERAFQEEGEFEQGCEGLNTEGCFLRWRRIRRDGTRRGRGMVMESWEGVQGIKEEARWKAGQNKSQKDFNNNNNFTSEIVRQQAAHLFCH